MENLSIGVSFKLVKSRTAFQKGTVYARLSLHGEVKDVATSVKCYLSEWADGKPIGINQTFIQEKLEAEKLMLLEVFNELLEQREANVENVALVYSELRKGRSFDKMEALENIKIRKEQVKEKKEQEISIVAILEEINHKKYKNGTIKYANWKGYKCIIDKIKFFLRIKNLEGIGYNKFEYALFEEMIEFLRFHKFSLAGFTKARKPNSNAHLRRIAQMVKAGNDYALKRGYTQKLLPQFDPFTDDSKETPFLTYQELKKLEKLDLSEDDVLDAIRDVFVFSCYTGLLYIDMKALDPKKHLEKDKKGNTWLIKPREKTKTKQVLPLLPKAKEILEKWDYTLPLYCEMSHNRTIKVLARQAGIRKHITNRVGRKTAGQIWLNEGVSIEVVAKMLGHKNIAITQRHYASIQKERIARETEHLMQPKQAPEETLQVPNTSQGNILDSIAELVAQKLRTA